MKALPCAFVAHAPSGLVWVTLYALLVLPLGVILARIVPPGQVADEPAHALRAYSVARGHIVGRRSTETVLGGVLLVSGVDADPGLASASLAFLDGGQTTFTDPVVANAAAFGWTGKEAFFQIGPIASYFPTFYLPAAGVMKAAEALGIKPLGAILGARFANLAAVVVLGGAALLATRRGHAVLFCILASPMTVSLGASLNPDGLMIAASVLAAALLTRQPTAAVAGPSFGIAAALLLCIGLAKPPFVPLSALLLAPLAPLSQWGRLRRVLFVRLGAVLCVALPVLAWAGFVTTHVLAIVPRPAYEAGPLWPGARPAIFNGLDPAAQAMVAAAHPIWMLILSWNVFAHGFRLLVEVIGVLGWLTVLLPVWLYFLCGAAAVAAVAGELTRPATKARLPCPLDLLLLIVVGFVTLFVVCLSQYLSFTPVGATRLEGVQGRYLLPLLPMLVLVLPQFRLPGGTLVSRACLVVPAIAAAAALVTVPRVVELAYYLH